jgi:hypothetical protein
MADISGPALPTPIAFVNGNFTTKGGLTRREYFAAAAAQGLLANVGLSNAQTPALIAQNAVKLADALIAELAKP